MDNLKKAVILFPELDAAVNRLREHARRVQLENIEMRRSLESKDEALDIAARRFHVVCSKRKKAGRHIAQLRTESAALSKTVHLLDSELDRLQRRIVTLEAQRSESLSYQRTQDLKEQVGKLTEERNHYRTIAGGVIDKVATDKTADLEAERDHYMDLAQKQAYALNVWNQTGVQMPRSEKQKFEEQISNLDRANNEKAAEIRQLKAKLTVIHESSDPQSAVTIERGF